MANAVSAALLGRTESRSTLWNGRSRRKLQGAASAEAIALARSVYEGRLPNSYSMRQCLELKHMNLSSDANRADRDEAIPAAEMRVEG